MEKNKIIEKIIEVLLKYNPSKIALFGSYARGEETPNSDIDVMVNFNKRISLLEWVGIEFELSEMVGKKVELISERAINPKLKPYIEKDLKIIFE